MNMQNSFDGIFQEAKDTPAANVRSDWLKAREIMEGYLKTPCEAADVDSAIVQLMSACPSLFETPTHAWSFLMDEPHEELESEFEYERQ